MAYIKLKTRKRIVNKAKGVKKAKSNSSVKKRTKLTATGLVVTGQAGKRHNMIKHSSRQKSAQKGTTVANSVVAKLFKKFFRLHK
jgi:large subunit ribosomal protein L35